MKDRGSATATRDCTCATTLPVHTDLKMAKDRFSPKDLPLTQVPTRAASTDSRSSTAITLGTDFAIRGALLLL